MWWHFDTRNLPYDGRKQQGKVFKYFELITHANYGLEWFSYFRHDKRTLALTYL